MIQRVQSIFLFLVAVSMVLHLLFPIWQKVDPAAGEVITINAFYLNYESYTQGTGERATIDSKSTIAISILAIIAAVVAMYSIFQYHNRLTQIKLGALNSLIMAATLMTGFYYIWKANELLSPTIEGNYLFGFYTVMMGLMFNMLANRFIRRDENLVRSADRIR